MKRQVVKFDDIEALLAEDELRGIVGGCAYWNGSSWSGDGSSGGYNGGDLGTVNVGGSSGGGTGSGNSPGPSGYPNGYPNTGWTTGTGNGGTSGAGGNSGGGTPPNYQTALYNYSMSVYGTFLKEHPNIILRTGTTPTGYTVTSDGKYVDANGTIVLGVTKKSGDLIFVDISDNVAALISNGLSPSLVGHELIHARHLIENYDLYVNSEAQFILNSELAAYSYQLNTAVAQSVFLTDPAKITASQNQINQLTDVVNQYIAKGAQGGFSTNLN